MATPKLALFTVIATLVYLGLAVLGWGGFAGFFSLTALAIVVFVMSVVALFSRGNLSAGQREDRSNRWVIAVSTVTGLLMAYLPAYRPEGLLDPRRGCDLVAWRRPLYSRRCALWMKAHSYA